MIETSSMKNSDNSNSFHKISWLAFIPSILSIIPFIGIPFGISAFLWGISEWKSGGKKIAIIAGLGFMSTILFGLYSYIKIESAFNSSVINEMKTKYAKSSLSYLVRFIEYYKLGHGHYPNSFDDLQEKDITYKKSGFIDPFTSSWVMPLGRPEEKNYFYEVRENGNSYVLFSVGPDKIPNTEDDIYPTILDEYKSVLGLRILH